MIHSADVRGPELPPLGTVGIALVAVISDWSAKWLAVRYLPAFDELVNTSEHAVRFAVAYNPNGPLNLFAPIRSSGVAFSVLAIVLLAYFLRVLVKSSPCDRWRRVGASLALGGVLGNLGNHWVNARGVVDFIAVPISSSHSAIFNPADVFLALGISILLVIAYHRDRSAPWWMRGLREL
jgi:lipoprotein signal peptidase